MNTKTYGYVNKVDFSGIALVVGLAMMSALTIFLSVGYSEASSARAEVPKKESLKTMVLNEARKNGLNENDVYALVACESRWDPELNNVNYNNRKGVDRGLWQISDKYHPEVSNSCAFNPKCATKEAIRIIKKKGYSEWVCGQILGLK